MAQETSSSPLFLLEVTRQSSLTDLCFPGAQTGQLDPSLPAFKLVHLQIAKISTTRG